ncbi:hypothetical protein CYY_010470 [Polysphondylium violaceum]|uniref:Uncharacterized protein n=1 Tax=Polysphondylium violaceum TaxID=133409 RepID=A0A8J4V1K1_9MYCE|nr:hypothetical protein CYY_010470 [Polysphondylium violaceum]
MDNSLVKKLQNKKIFPNLKQINVDDDCTYHIIDQNVVYLEVDYYDPCEVSESEEFKYGIMQLNQAKAWKESASTSLSASVSGPSFSVEASVSASVDKSQFESSQEEKDQSSSTSRNIVYGGAPAAFSPGYDEH